MREHEHTLNVWLSDLLRQRGLNARQERMQGGRRIDVEVRVGPVRIALEAEQGQTNAKKREAIADADRRLEQGLAECAIAVCHPEGITEPQYYPAQPDAMDDPRPQHIGGALRSAVERGELG